MTTVPAATTVPAVATGDPGEDASWLDDTSGAETAPAGATAILLRLGGSRYAVAMADLAEVLVLPSLTRVPGAPGWLLGVGNWRGRILPVLDLRPLLGVDAPVLPSSARAVALTDGTVTVAVVAEAVTGVLDGPCDPTGPTPPTFAPSAAALLRGLLRDAQGPLAVIDAAAVLALRERLPRR